MSDAPPADRGSGQSSAPTLTDSTGSEQARPNPLGVRLERGHAIKRYVILYELGSGGMGVVYAAYDPELDRKIALKLLHADRSGRRARARLLREAKAIARLNHPNVVTVHDVGTYAGQVFVAMEYIDGATLRQWLEAERRPWRATLRVLLEAGRGLAAAHEADLIHRDFKPDNVLVHLSGGRSGRVVVLDFGLARRTTSRDDGSTGETKSGAWLLNERERLSLPGALGEGAERERELTRTGARLGTPAYMAPEQHLLGPMSARTDQFSFCVVAWEALYGRRPFRGESNVASIMSVVRGELEEPPRGTQVPAYVRRALLRGLSPDPDARFPDMDALLTALDGRRGRVRRRWTLAGLAFTSVVAGSFTTAWSWSGEPRCEGAETRWTGGWDDDRRYALREAFGATELPYAEAAFTEVEAALDRYVQDWSATYRDVCRATHVLGEQSESLLDVRMACLRERLTEARALTDELDHPDGPVVEFAVEAVHGLSRVSDCRHAEPTSATPEPRNPAEARLVERARLELSDARAKEAAGRYEAAAALAREVWTQAEQLGYGPLIAEARLRLGSVLERQGDFEGAEQHLLAAVWDASASHDDELAAEAWVRLVWVSGVERLDVERGHLWAEFADAALHRIGDPELLRASLIHNRGGVLYVQGRVSEALGAYEAALAVQQRLLGEHDPAVAMTLNHIGNALIELSRFDEARTYCERSLASRRAVLGDRHPKVAASLNNLAELLRKQGRPEDSLVAAKRSLTIVAGTDGPEELVALTLAGSAESSLGRWHDAVRTHTRLLELRRQRSNRSSIALTMRDLAIAMSHAGRVDDAVMTIENAMQLVGDGDREQRLAMEQTLMELQLAAGQLEAAGQTRMRALEIAEQLGDTSSIEQLDAVSAKHRLAR